MRLQETVLILVDHSVHSTVSEALMEDEVGVLGREETLGLSPMVNSVDSILSAMGNHQVDDHVVLYCVLFSTSL